MNTNKRIPKTQTRNVLIWLFSFVFAIFLIIICFAVLFYSFLKEPNPDLTQLKTSLPMDIISFCLLTIPLSLLIFPELLYGIPQRKKNKKVNFIQREEADTNNEEIKLSENDSISNKVTASKKEENNPIQSELELKDIEPRFIELSQSILAYIKKSKILLNPNFSMEELSRSMNVPKHHLYYCFNSVLKIKLTKIRAELRIEYAKKLIEDGLLDSLTLDAIVSTDSIIQGSSIDFQSIFFYNPL